MKKKPVTVFVQFPSKDDEENVSVNQHKSVKVSIRRYSVVMVITMWSRR